MSKDKNKKKTSGLWPHQQKKQPLLIDTLEKALRKAGLEIERDGWTENSQSDPPHDECEWIDINLLDKEGNQITVHFYFSQGSTRLDEVTVYKAKKRTGFDMPKTFAKPKWEEEKK